MFSDSRYPCPEKPCPGIGNGYCPAFSQIPEKEVFVIRSDNDKFFSKRRVFIEYYLSCGLHGESISPFGRASFSSPLQGAGFPLPPKPHCNGKWWGKKRFKTTSPTPPWQGGEKKLSNLKHSGCRACPRNLKRGGQPLLHKGDSIW